MTLETVNEETEDDNSSYNFENNNNYNMYQKNTNILNAKRIAKNTNSVKYKETNQEKYNNTTKTLYDTGFMLSPVFLENADKDSLKSFNELNFRTRAFFAAPIMFVNPIHGSFSSSDIEISGDRKSVCISEHSQPASTIIHNLKRTSVTSGNFSGKHIWYGISLGTLIIMTTIIATLMVTWPSESDPTKSGYTRREFYIGESWFVTRSEWKAKDPKNKTYLTLPVHFLIIGATNTKFLSTKEDCIEEIRYIQGVHMYKKNWNDIGYNYLVCGNNSWVFEGRGANIVGSHTRGFNSRSIMIALVGKFNETVRAPESMIDRIDVVLQYLKHDDKVSAKAIVLGKSYVSDVTTNIQQSATKHILNIINNIKHWSPLYY